MWGLLQIRIGMDDIGTSLAATAIWRSNGGSMAKGCGSQLLLFVFYLLWWFFFFLFVG